VSTVAGSGSPGSVDGTGSGGELTFPTGVTFDAAGNLVVAAQVNHHIRKITPASVVTTFAGSGSMGSSDGTGIAAPFDSPTGVAFDSAGNLFVADQGNNKIRKITPAGVVSTFAGSGSD